jgi:Flp pilus assembly protein TadB
MDEKRLSDQESLQIIQQMIQVAKDDHRENGEGWLIWGWLLFLASVVSMILGLTDARNYIGWTWTAMLIIGLIVYLVSRLRRKDKGEVKTYVQELLNKLGVGFFISLFALVAAGFMIKNIHSFGYYYILYAFWMFIHGNAIRFRPLIIGAYVNWAAGISLFFLNDITIMMLVSAVAILAGYLVPGYLLRADYRKKRLS